MCNVTPVSQNTSRILILGMISVLSVLTKTINSAMLILYVKF